MINYEQWMVMEEEAKRLCNLVEKQRDRINELIKLISEEGKYFISLFGVVSVLNSTKAIIEPFSSEK